MVVPVLRMEDVMPCLLRSNALGLGPDQVLPEKDTSCLLA